MSDPLNTAEIEDVVSSIRRLVSSEQRPRSRDLAYANLDKLLLTPALRIVPDRSPDTGPSDSPTEETAVPEPASAETEAEPEAVVAVELEQAESGAGSAADPEPWDITGGEPQSIEAIWEDELWAESDTGEISEDIEDAELVLSEADRVPQDEAVANDKDAPVATPPAHIASGSEPDDEDRPIQFVSRVRSRSVTAEEADAAKAVAAAAAAVSPDARPEPVEVTGPTDTQDQTAGSVAEAPSVSDQTEPAIETSAGDVETGVADAASEPPTDTAEMDTSSHDVEARDAEPPGLAAVPQTDGADNEMQDTASASAADTATDTDRAGVVVALHDELDDFDDGELSGTIDETVLTEIVRDLIREEFQGALGERITRSVRKLVRAEISRALAARSIE